MCLSGEALSEEIYDYIARWHRADTTMEVNEYLGMTDDEYLLWLEKPEMLNYIIFARKHGITVIDALQNAETIAARAESQGKAQKLMGWLRKTGRIL